MRKPRLLLLGTVVAGIVSVTAALIAGPTPSSEIKPAPLVEVTIWLEVRWTFSSHFRQCDVQRSIRTVMLRRSVLRSHQ